MGLVVAAVFQMSFKVRSLSPHPDASVVIGILAFYATHFGVPRFWASPVVDDKGQAVVSPPWKMPAPLAILAGGVLGLLAWARVHVTDALVFFSGNTHDYIRLQSEYTSPSS